LPVSGMVHGVGRPNSAAYIEYEPGDPVNVIKGGPQHRGSAVAGILAPLLALVRTKVMKTVPFRIPVRLSGILETLGHHGLGLIGVIRIFFFLTFAVHAYRFMGIHREDSLVVIV